MSTVVDTCRQLQQLMHHWNILLGKYATWVISNSKSNQFSIVTDATETKLLDAFYPNVIPISWSHIPSRLRLELVVYSDYTKSGYPEVTWNLTLQVWSITIPRSKSPTWEKFRWNTKPSWTTQIRAHVYFTDTCESSMLRQRYACPWAPINNRQLIGTHAYVDMCRCSCRHSCRPIRMHQITDTRLTHVRTNISTGLPT